MAKIGILSFPGHQNHGANLTAYALQQALADMGHTAENVVLHCNYLVCKHPLYTDFSDKHIRVNDLGACGEAGMRLFNESYDTFIVGSDQVWRREAPPSWWATWKPKYDPCFWLRFADPSKRRISVAASFGTDSFKGDATAREEFSCELKRFTAISVREESGRDLVRSISGMESACIVDPVFYLPVERWEALMAPAAARSGRPVVAYSSFVDARYISEKLAPAFPEYEFVNLLEVSTPEMLRTIHDAAFVLTDSFHVTVFSIIFRVPMAILIINRPLGSERYYRLFDLFRISRERIISTGKEQDAAPAIRAAMALPFDREVIPQVIRREADAALAWLRDALATPPVVWKDTRSHAGCLARLREKLTNRRWKFIAKHTLAAYAFRIAALISPIVRRKLADRARYEQARVDAVPW